MRLAVLALALALTAVTPRLDARIARDPLYPALQAYDRQIAALESTQRDPMLSGAPAEADHAAMALAHQAAAARAQVATLATARAAAYAESERRLKSIAARAQDEPDAAALAQRIARTYREQQRALQSTARGDMAAYRAGLAAQETQTLAAFRAAMALRTARAVAARAQTMREKESTLAFDLERADAGQRLVANVKLADLRQDHAHRAALRAKLAAMDAREGAAVARLHAADEAELAAYRAQMQAREASDDAAMASSLARKTAANLAQRENALRAQTLAVHQPLAAFGDAPASPEPPAPDLRARAALLARSYDLDAEGSSIENGFGTASTDLAAAFRRLAGLGRASDDATQRELQRLRAARAKLYKTLLARAGR